MVSGHIVIILIIISVSLITIPNSSIIPVQVFSQEDKLVILYTPSGKLVIEFFPEDAPNHVDNFIKLNHKS